VRGRLRLRVDVCVVSAGEEKGSRERRMTPHRLGLGSAKSRALFRDVNKGRLGLHFTFSHHTLRISTESTRLTCCCRDHTHLTNDSTLRLLSH